MLYGAGEGFMSHAMSIYVRMLEDRNRYGSAFVISVFFHVLVVFFLSFYSVHSSQESVVEELTIELEITKEEQPVVESQQESYTKRQETLTLHEAMKSILKKGRSDNANNNQSNKNTQNDKKEAQSQNRPENQKVVETPDVPRNDSLSTEGGDPRVKRSFFQASPFFIPLSAREKNNIRSQIKNHWKTAAYRGHMELDMILRLDIHGNISIVSTKRHNSSNHPQYELFVERAMRAVKLSSPL